MSGRFPDSDEEVAGLTSGRQSRRRRLRRRRDEDTDSNPILILAAIGVLVALGLSIWALVHSYHHEHHTLPCGSKCCQEAHAPTSLLIQYPEDLAHLCFDDDDVDCAFAPFVAPGFDPFLDAAGGITNDDDDVAFCVDSRPFTFTVPEEGSGPVLGGGLDHVKFLSYFRDPETYFRAWPTTAPASAGHCHEDMELVFSGNVTCQVDLDLENFPYDPQATFQFLDEDYRVAACGFNSIAFQDFNNGVGRGAWKVADFFLTNKRIFVLDERLPFGKPGFSGNLNDYLAYTTVLPSVRRNPDDYHKLAIAYNPARRMIRWLIDDVEVHREINPGYGADSHCDVAIHHGGTPEDAFPENVSFGFGTFSIMDAFHWNTGECRNYEAIARLTPGATDYYDPDDFMEYGGYTPADESDFVAPFPTPGDLAWGQGAQMCIDWLRVDYQRCGNCATA